MLIDSLLVLMDGEDLSVGIGQVYSSNVINTSTVVGDFGAGEPLYLIICVDEAFTSSGSTATVKFSLVDSASTTIDSGSVEIVSTDTLVVTRLPLGKIIVLPVPAGLITQQYLGVRVDIGVDTTDTGKVTAFIGTGAQTWNV